MAEPLLGNFTGLWGQRLLPPEALRLAQTCRAAHALRSELLLSVSPAWRCSGGTREELLALSGRPAHHVPQEDVSDSDPEDENFDPAPVVNGLQFCALGAYYRRTTPERDALLLLDLDRAPPLPNGWARSVLGNEALHLAVRYGHSKVLRWLRGAYGLDATDARFRICIDIRQAVLWSEVYELNDLARAPPVARTHRDLLATFLRAACGDTARIRKRASAPYWCSARRHAAAVETANTYWCAARCLAVGDGCALKAAIAFGHAGCVRALCETYELSAADALRDDTLCLCSIPNPEPGDLSRDPQSPLDEAMQAALWEEGGLDVLLAVWEAAGLWPRVLAASNWVEILRRGAEAGRLSLLKWVETTWLGALKRARRNRIPWKEIRADAHPRVLAWIDAATGPAGSSFDATAGPADNSSSDSERTSEGGSSS